MTTIDFPDDRPGALATIHNRFTRVWMRKDLGGMTAQIAALQAALA